MLGFFGPWWIILLRGIVVAAMITIIVWLVKSRRREQQSTMRWEMLSRVSAGLAEILRADTRLEDVLRLLVPQFADWCAVHLVEDGGVRRAAVVHADPEIEARVRKR